MRAFRLRLDGAVEAADANVSPDAVSAALAKYFADRDNPTPLKSDELSGRGSAKDLYYSFTAGPGELKLNLEVTATSSTVTLELFDANANKLVYDENRTAFAVNSNGIPIEEHAKFDLDREEQILMRISCSNPNSLKSFRLKLEGATKLEGASEPEASDKPQAGKAKQ
jgi:hypothetical protein